MRLFLLNPRRLARRLLSPGRRRGLVVPGLSACLMLLAGCTMLDYSRADGGLAAPAARPWAVDSLDGNNSLARLGAEQNPRILTSYGGEYRDAGLERMVAKIVGRLTAVSESPGQSYRVVILDSANINAFALPGGYVYVTRGLLALANDSAEVAAVIAHEMAHITANHGLLRARKEKEIALSDRVATEILAGNQRDETLIRSRLKLAGFSRGQELQADSIGIRMAAAAGYDPFAAPRFLQAMEDYSRFRDISGAKDASLDFLSNHPSAPQRVRLAVMEARKLGAPAVGDTDRPAFLRGIDGMIFGDDTIGSGLYLRGRSFINSREGFMFSVPPGFSLSYKNGIVTAAGRDDTALRFDSAALEKPQSARAYIAGGWVSGLDKASIRTGNTGGLPAAQARAQNAQWQFSVLVLMGKNRVYRFLTAAPRHGHDPAAAGLETAGSFRLLSPQEKAAVKPLRLHIQRVEAGDTAAGLAAGMQFNDRSLELFRLINGLSARQAVYPGAMVKMIRQ